MKMAQIVNDPKAPTISSRVKPARGRRVKPHVSLETLPVVIPMAVSVLHALLVSNVLSELRILIRLAIPAARPPVRPAVRESLVSY